MNLRTIYERLYKHNLVHIYLLEDFPHLGKLFVSLHNRYCAWYYLNQSNKITLCQGDKEENSQIFLCFSPSVSILELIVKLYISIVLFS